MPDTLSLVVTVEQAERLLKIVDAENAMRKNHCVSYLTEGNNERAVEAALDSQFLTTLRAAISHRLRHTLARPVAKTAAEHLAS